MVDGETYECVKRFCYLGDTIDGNGVADRAATDRIRTGWMKFREVLPFLTSRSPPLNMKGGIYASCVGVECVNNRSKDIISLIINVCRLVFLNNKIFIFHDLFTCTKSIDKQQLLFNLLQ